jgi:hypothetical protein
VFSLGFQIRTYLELQVRKPHSQAFSQSLVIGAAAKEILRALLEASGYRVYPFGYESSLSTLKMHVFESHLPDSNAVQRVRSMPDYVVSSEKGLKLVEVKFRRKSEHESKAGVYLKNSDLNRYRQYWEESVIALISPHGERFFYQSVRELIPGPLETKWFDYSSFQPLPDLYPSTSDKLKAFGVAVDKLGTLWDEHKN